MKKILLIEDDQLLGKLYSDLMTAKNFNFVWETDGEKAYQSIMTNNWDLVILDTLLPNKNALQILTDLKKNSPMKLTNKIIIFTNLSDSKILEELKKFNLEIIIKSQLDPELFIKKISEYVNS